MAHYPHVIFLNGPSSVGKTSLAHALQDTLGVWYLHFGLDFVLAMMPKRLNNWDGKPVEPNQSNPDGFSYVPFKDPTNKSCYTLAVGKEGERMTALMHVLAKTILQEYGHIIIDDVAYGGAAIDVWKKVLQGYECLWVGLTAPIVVLEERERARPDRLNGIARAQWYTVHKGVTYDLFFDTSQESIKNMANTIITTIMNA